jgi:hypothetical protein
LKAQVPLQIFDGLRELGYKHGDLFVNWPPEPTADTSIRDLKELGLDENDVLLLTTRPPLTDEPDQQKPIYRTGSALEKMYFKVLQTNCFYECSRTCVAVLPHSQGCLPSEL